MMPKPADEWFNYAKDDLEAGEILFRENIFTTTCFHAQQAAEKSLKAFLVANGISPPWIHNLVRINALCVNIDKEFDAYLGKLTTINQFYMPTRYPDAPAGMGPKGTPTKDTAREVLDYGREVFDFCSEKVKQIEQQKVAQQQRVYKPKDRGTEQSKDKEPER